MTMRKTTTTTRTVTTTLTTEASEEKAELAAAGGHLEELERKRNPESLNELYQKHVPEVAKRMEAMMSGGGGWGPTSFRVQGNQKPTCGKNTGSSEGGQRKVTEDRRRTTEDGGGRQ